MIAAAFQASRSRGRRWLALLALSALFHAAVLGAFALRVSPVGAFADPDAMDVSLVPPAPFIRPLAVEAAKAPPRVRLAILDAPPRFAPAQAPTGEAGDAVDLFGPVFADGLWPRPVVVSSEACDLKADPERQAACRRELLLIGLASDASAGAKARP